MTEPPWLEHARRHLGVREVPGMRHEPLILAWWRAIKRGGIKDDETPWCAAFVGAMLEAVGLMSTRFEGARSYATWGQPLPYAAMGAIVVLWRRGGGGHVGFEVGRDAVGNVMLLGGNQSNAVSVAAFSPARIVARRWPAPVALPDPGVRLHMAAAELSRSEA